MIEPEDKKKFLEHLKGLLDLRYKFDPPMSKVIGDCYISLRRGLDAIEEEDDPGKKEVD